ncbi:MULTISPECIES: ROK family protein [unclassified Sphingomonas]|jgi:fructokinase|uniref:ROK family protein n=1 Tax=unclassified Sphingomonas TaxID=196159 RepID=UPI000B21C24E|nr:MULTISPECIES: ROK family protein [unclassified Sphingomonas]
MGPPRFAGIDAGGTSFKLAVASGLDTILAETRIPTTTPAETLARAGRWLAEQGPLAGLGMGAFGPVGIGPGASHGRLFVTPKPGWSGVDLIEPLARHVDAPIALDTDVNVAALAEQRLGAGQDVESFAYVTIGTGVGLGLVVGGKAARSRLHPEAGHIFVPHHPARGEFPGACALHGDCVEGMACSAAITARWGVSPDQLPDGHPAWDMLGHYLGHLALNAVLVAGVDRVILGGGIGTRPILAAQVTRSLSRLIGGYGAIAEARGGVETMVRTAALGPGAGTLGALLLAMDAAA